MKVSFYQQMLLIAAVNALGANALSLTENQMEMAQTETEEDTIADMMSGNDTKMDLLTASRDDSREFKFESKMDEIEDQIDDQIAANRARCSH